MQRDSEAFDAALFLRMREIDTEQQERKDTLLEPDLEAFLLWPRSFVSVEGLALLALARRLGITVSSQDMCPTEGQLPSNSQDTENFFKGIERLLASP